MEYFVKVVRYCLKVGPDAEKSWGGGLKVGPDAEKSWGGGEKIT